MHPAHLTLLLPQAAKPPGGLLLLPLLLLTKPHILLPHGPQPPIQDFLHPSVKELLVLPPDQLLKVLLPPGVGGLLARLPALLCLLFLQLHGHHPFPW